MQKERRGRAKDPSKKDTPLSKRERGSTGTSSNRAVVPPAPTPEEEQESALKHLEILLAERTRDLTEALRRLKAKEEEEERATHLNHAPFGFFTLDAELRVVYCNSAAARIWGTRREELLGKSLWPARDDKRADELIRKRILDSFRKDKSDSFDAFSARTGKWLTVHTVPSDGTLLVYLRDITAEKRKDEITTRLWRESCSLTENSPDLILRFDEHLHCSFANKAAASAGFSSQISTGEAHGEMSVARVIAGRLGPALKEAMRTGLIQSDQFDLATRAGKKIFSFRAIPETGLDGRTRSVLVVAGDVTAQKEEERVRGRLTAAIEEATEGVIVVEPDGTVTYVNEALCHITGYERTELTGAPISLLGSAVDAGVVRTIRESLSRNEPWAGRFGARKKQGGELQCDLHLSPVRGASGSVTGFVGIARDVTREAELEKQLRESQKLEAIGTLSGGIAHDFNNMLAVIVGNAELATDESEPDSPIRRNISRILTAALRGRDLVKQILSFSRRSPQHVKPFPLAPLVRETVKLLRSTLPATTEIHLEIGTAEDIVVADPTQMQQVLMNLATNASQAMGQEGRLTIRLTEVCFDSQYPLPDPELRPGDYLVLTVKDTGPGMDEATRQHIFEPFFTTKQVGQGTGLGLAVVYGIVKAHEGVITVSSAPGKGATFRVFLPKGPASPVEATPPEAPLPGGAATILVVDDEEPIVLLRQQMLSKLGYNVHAETDPEKALQTFSEDPERFALVIVDQAMPRMSGLTLARHLMERRPSIPIIMSTGYSAVVDEQTAKEAGIKAFLMKPMTREQLATTVKKVLAGSDVPTGGRT